MDISGGFNIHLLDMSDMVPFFGMYQIWEFGGLILIFPQYYLLKDGAKGNIIPLICYNFYKNPNRFSHYLEEIILNSGVRSHHFLIIKKAM